MAREAFIPLWEHNEVDYNSVQGNPYYSNKRYFRPQPYKPRVEDWIWAAALFIGEGSFGTQKNHREERYLILQINMQDELAITHLAHIWGANYRCWDDSRHSNTVWKTNISGTRGVKVAQLMQPYMDGTAKGDQLLDCMELVEVYT